MSERKTTSERKTYIPIRSEMGLSLLQFLKARTKESGKRVKRAIDGCACMVNWGVQKYSTYRIQRGDQVVLHLDRFEKEKKAEFVVLHEDEHFRAVYKPPFYVCSGDEQLHRLDKETSGVLLESEEQAFFDLFRNKQIEKEYLCIVEGKIADKGQIKNRLGVVMQLQGQKIMGETPDGKLAITEWQVLSRKGKLVLVRCNLVTGRTHQIRTHLASIGAPILGDYQYGGPYSVRPKRMLLHAKGVTFIHPITKEKVHITAAIPADFLEHFDENLCR